MTQLEHDFVPGAQRPATPAPARLVRNDALTPTAARPVRVHGRSLPADAHLAPHYHPWAQLAYCTRGAIQVLLDGEQPMSCIAPPSRAVWIPPGTPHAIHTLQASTTHTLYFYAGALPASAQAPRVLAVTALLRELILALDANLPPAREALIARLMLDELQQADAEPLGVPLPRTAGDKRLRALCEAVLRDPAAHASLAQWARSVGASERTMTRLFQAELGCSYQAWRQQAVLAHALPMVTAGHPIAQVAAACGYASESAFSAMFKCALGQSPSALRG